MLADFEVRLVMHVHAIKVPTRTTFASTLHIARALWEDVKQADEHLPVWPNISDLAPTPSASVSVAKIQELREDGNVPNSELSAIGFDIDGDID